MSTLIERTTVTSAVDRLGVSAACSCEEEEVIARAKTGDASAWTVLFDCYYPTLYRYAYARLRLREDAEDVASQAFMVALRGIHTFNYRGKPLLAWLYRVTRNLVAEHLRRRRSLGETFDRLRAGTVSPALAAPEDMVDAYDLLDAVSQLTKDQREVIILRFLVSLPTKQVAHILGKKEEAVCSLQARAINALRRQLADHSPLLETSSP
ncbi:MAG: sigma-70 family RNA polymerase sigma factor [Chloroflexi bacterium]|nr:sigma-70 family RNA polymerase sigma factor [Chloroflexota bacterium]